MNERTNRFRPHRRGRARRVENNKRTGGACNLYPVQAMWRARLTEHPFWSPLLSLPADPYPGLFPAER